MTEQEAKTKWCPMVRSSSFSNNAPYAESAVNRNDAGKTDEQRFSCIASDCMLWEWDGYEKKGHCGLCR